MNLTRLITLFIITVTWLPAADPLPSWNEGATKQAIVTFVTRVTTAGTPTFVPAAERIATFDHDGTLWAEQPTRQRKRHGCACGVLILRFAPLGFTF